MRLNRHSFQQSSFLLPDFRLLTLFIVVIFLFFPLITFSGSYTVKTDDIFFFPLQSGFPVEVDGWIAASVAFGNVDSDNKIELCFTTRSPFMTFLLDDDGSLINASWPKNGGRSTPSFADFDKDGELEIVSVGIVIDVWRLNGTSFPGWPYVFNTGDSYTSAPVADLDGNDFVEVSSGFSDVDKYFTVIHSSGTTLSGFPISVDARIYNSPGVVDLNSDGINEIIIGQRSYNNEKVIAIDLSGSIFQGNWGFNCRTFGLGGPVSDLTLADIDGDHRPEIMFGTDFDPGGNGLRHAVVLNHDKTFAAGWPKEVHSYLYGGLSTGDIDGDGKLEVACVSGIEHDGTNWVSKVYVWNGEDGSDVPGWPKDVIDFDFSGNVIIGDIDGDCDQELMVGGFIFSTKTTHIFAWHHDGTTVSGFPLTINGFHCQGGSSCFITDIDNDGDVEIGIGVGNDVTDIGRVYVWDLPYPYRKKCPPDWPQYNHDAQHTGNYHHPNGLPVFRVPILTNTGFVAILALFTVLLIRRTRIAPPGR